MQDILVGSLAVAVGALFCWRGYLTMRVIIPIWGGFAGFVLGAGLVAAVDDDNGFLRSAVAWLVGLAIGILFAAGAYLYFEIAVSIAMAAMGFVLGTGLMVALGVRWSWLIIAVGVITGVVLAVVAIAADLPMVLLIVLTAVSGATTVVAGVMLLVDAVETAWFTSDAATQRLDDEWWWYVLVAVLAVAGIVAQLAAIDRRHTTIRQAWDEGGNARRAAPSSP